MIDLSGKHILVVGGSRGIGAAAARMAAKAGADVSVNYVSNAAAAEKVVADITALGRRGAALQGDASAEGDMERVADEAVASLGPLHGLVVSAGIFEGHRIENMTAEFWDRTFAINVRGTMLAVKAAVRKMREHGRGGSIVIYTSTAGQRGSAGVSNYAASKAAQILFMRSMGMELGPEQIRCNCVAPAWTETDMADASLTQLGRENVAKDFALGRIGLPDDIAGATVYLLSDLASFVTGMTLTVDGGMDFRG